MSGLRTGTMPAAFQRHPDQVGARGAPISIGASKTPQHHRRDRTQDEDRCGIQRPGAGSPSLPCSRSLSSFLFEQQRHRRDGYESLPFLEHEHHRHNPAASSLASPGPPLPVLPPEKSRNWVAGAGLPQSDNRPRFNLRHSLSLAPFPGTPKATNPLSSLPLFLEPFRLCGWPYAIMRIAAFLIDKGLPRVAHRSVTQGPPVKRFGEMFVFSLSERSALCAKFQSPLRCSSG
jgi:hypothetical protein